VVHWLPPPNRKPETSSVWPPCRYSTFCKTIILTKKVYFCKIYLLPTSLQDPEVSGAPTSQVRTFAMLLLLILLNWGAFLWHTFIPSYMTWFKILNRRHRQHVYLISLLLSLWMESRLKGLTKLSVVIIDNVTGFFVFFVLHLDPSHCITNYSYISFKCHIHLAPGRSFLQAPGH
jgi:hypothetical protein